MKNTNLKFYDQLLKLHLFQGVGRSDLAQIVGHSKIGFESVEEGETIAHSGDNYEKMLFLTSGKAKVTVAAFDKAGMGEVIGLLSRSRHHKVRCV